MNASVSAGKSEWRHQGATVLIGFAEAMSAPEVVWSLVDRGYRAIAFSRKGERSALQYSRHVRCHEITPPEVDLGAALSDLTALCRDQSCKAPLVLFPLDDAAVWLCSRVPVDPQLTLAGPSAEGAEVALDKTAQIRFARAAGFAVPDTRVCANAGELRDLARSFPIIVRPAEAGWEEGGRFNKGGVWICQDQREFETVFEKWKGAVPVLVQAYIRGVGEGVFGLATKDGVRAWSAHRRVRMMNPHGSGSSACASQLVAEEVKGASERFVQHAGWRGLFMIELIRDVSGKLWFVEFNGRPWGSMALFRRQGMEYPAWSVDLVLDSASSSGTGHTVATGPIVCRHLGRELMHLLFVLKGPKSNALVWPSFWKTLPEILQIRKGQHFYNWRRDDFKVFVADCYLTIRRNIVKPRKGH